MTMTDTQKAICRELLKISYECGFGSYYPLAPIAAKLGIEGGLALYDANTESGVLWDLGENGKALLGISRDGFSASVHIETLDLIEAWSR